MVVVLVGQANVAISLLVWVLTGLTLHSLSYHPLRLFDVPAPCLHERSQLRPLHDAMVRRPTDAQHQPPLALPLPALDVPHPARPTERDDRNAAAGHKQRHRALARADGADVAHGERPAAPRELGGRERAGYLSPEVREVLERCGEAVDRVRVHGADGWRVESRRRRERYAYIGMRAKRQGRLATARDAPGRD